MQSLDSKLTFQVVKQFAALAHVSRLTLFRRLVVAGPAGCNAGDLAQQCALSPTLVSFHMKELLHAGLVHAEPHGRYVRYCADLDAMHALLAFMTENCCGGQMCAPDQSTCAIPTISSTHTLTLP